MLKRSIQVHRLITIPSLALSLILGVGATDVHAEVPCPSDPAHVGIFSAQDFNTKIPLKMSGHFEVCNDLNAYELEQIRGGYNDFYADPYDYASTFTGTIDFRNHKVTVPPSDTPSVARGAGIDIRALAGTIKNLVIENPPGLYQPPVSGYLVAWEAAGNARFENITLRNARTGSGLVLSGSNVIFDSVRGDVKIWVPANNLSYRSAIAQECKNCEFRRLDLDVNLRVADQTHLPANVSPKATYVGGLVGLSEGGYIRIFDSTLRGSLEIGSIRGMLMSAKYGGWAYDANGVATPNELTIRNVRVIDANLPEPSGPSAYRSYSVGALAGYIRVPTEVSDVLVRNATVEGTVQAGGLFGGSGGGLSIRRSAVADSRVKAREVAGGLVAWAFDTHVEDSYFRGEVHQDITFGRPDLSTFYAAGGLLGVNTAQSFTDGTRSTLSVIRSYAVAQVTASGGGVGGGIIGGDPSVGDLTLALTESAYFDSSLAPHNGIGSARTPEDLITPATFVGFSVDTWALEQGKLPRLVAVAEYTLQDLFSFLNLFFQGDIRADTDESGTIDTNDLFRFLELFLNA